MARHFEGQDAIEEVPEVHDIALAGLHVHVDGPHVPTFGMRVDNAFEDRLSSLWITELVLELRKLADRLQV